MLKGSCLCRAVTFEVDGELEGADACHCTMCRKTSGHFFASTNVARAALRVQGDVAWYPSSKDVRRGFCKTCGSTLFWDPIAKDYRSIAMGAFDGPTNAKLHVHIFVVDKGDYYELNDGLPQRDRY
jgi:hypothetical protein